MIARYARQLLETSLPGPGKPVSDNVRQLVLVLLPVLDRAAITGSTTLVACCYARFGGKIIHFVVEQESRSGDRHRRSITLVERVGARDDVAFAVDNGEVRRLRRLVTCRLTRSDALAFRGARGVNVLSSPLRITP